MARKPEPTGPKPSLPGLIKVQVLYSTTTLTRTYTAANVFHCLLSNTATPTLGNLLTWLGTWGGDFDTRFKPFRNPTWKTSTYVATMLDGSGLTGSASAGVAGTAANLPSLPQAAVCVTWRAAAYWRGGKPRTYLPGPPSTATSTAGDSLLTSTYANGLATAAENFITDVSAIGIGSTFAALGAVSYYSRYAFRQPPLFLPYISAVVHDRMASQRRRSGKESLFPID